MSGVADFDPHLIESLREAQHVAVLTGAGVSAESGVPTFRDALTGLWSKFDPAELASPEAFQRDPELVTRWYDERRRNVAACNPNPGHVALVTLERHAKSRGATFTLITQNVDALHQSAGSSNVIELHGSLWLWRCTRCGQELEERNAAPFATYPPRCESCNAPRRPGVVWFGEALPADAIDHAQKTASDCDLFLTLGTSSVVYPAAGLIDVAMRSGAKILEINPQETPYSSRADWSLRGKSGELLPALLAAAGVS